MFAAISIVRSRLWSDLECEAAQDPELQQTIASLQLIPVTLALTRSCFMTGIGNFSLLGAHPCSLARVPWFSAGWSFRILENLQAGCNCSFSERNVCHHKAVHCFL